MKRIVIVSILFVICVGVSIYCAYHVNEVTEYIDHRATGALQAIADADEEALHRYVDDLSAFWDEEEDRLIHFVRHAQIEDITKSIARLQALAAGEDYSELAAELDSIRWQVEHMNRSERKVLANLL